MSAVKGFVPGTKPAGGGVNYPAPLGRGFPAIMANTCTTEM